MPFHAQDRALPSAIIFWLVIEAIFCYGLMDDGNGNWHLSRHWTSNYVTDNNQKRVHDCEPPILQFATIQNTCRIIWYWRHMCRDLHCLGCYLGLRVASNNIGNDQPCLHSCLHSCRSSKLLLFMVLPTLQANCRQNVMYMAPWLYCAHLRCGIDIHRIWILQGRD